jgi:hypothetical protein
MDLPNQIILFEKQPTSMPLITARAQLEYIYALG